MRRREFVVCIGTVALAWPLVTRAQRTTIPFVGFLHSGSPNDRKHLIEAFRQGLKEGGYVDGQDVAIEYRWAEGRYDRMSELAVELVNRKVAVIAATGGLALGLAAKSATSTIPIVFTGAGDPVKLGLVRSLSRPGGNVTGIANNAGALHTKRLEILRDLVPGVTRIAYLMNPKNPDAQSFLREIQTAANTAGMKIDVLKASSEAEIDAELAVIRQTQAKALLVAADALFTNQLKQIVSHAARAGIPASYAFREFAIAGGLMSYGPNVADGYRQAGIYTARILKGAKPGDLPVLQSAKFELVVNLKTAKNLGLAISRDFLARVDEVIQ